MAHTYITTYDLPNYIGELFQKGQRPNTTLQLIGGIGAWRPISSWEFPVGQQYEVPAHAADRSKLEGADAPDHAGVTRSQITNVTQIWQESVVVTYTKQAASQQLSGLGVGGMTDPVTNELDFQTGIKLELIARNLNWTLLNQAYRKPSDNTTSRKTRGLLAAITTTKLQHATPGTARALTMSLLDDVFASMLTAGGIVDGENMIVLAGPIQMRKLNELFRTDKLKVDEDRFVAGTRVRTVYTTFGVLNFALEQDMLTTGLAFVNFDVMQLVATDIPAKGTLFREELAKTGASEKHQIYGELGLDHGPEWFHGQLLDLAV